jgi:hypothetical protein
MNETRVGVLKKGRYKYYKNILHDLEGATHGLGHFFVGRRVLVTLKLYMNSTLYSNMYSVSIDQIDMKDEWLET